MLLDEIIAILSDEKGTLNSALLKTKVLLHTLGKKDLATWVTNELKGYPDENVPEYRIVKAQVRGHLTSIAWHVKDTALPVLHLPEDQRKGLTSQRCTMSISSIEEAVNSYRTKGSKLARPLPPEYGIFFKDALADGMEVFSAWCELNPVDIQNILSEVRSRLLDFVLELRDVVGMDVPEKELAEKAAAFDTERQFATSIYGSGNTIIIGSHHIQSITNQKDDLQGLIETIAKLGFQQPDLDELKQAVLEDKSSGKTPDVAEGETGKWYTKAVKSAGKEIVKAGVDIVSSVIVKAIKAYTTGSPE